MIYNMVKPSNNMNLSNTKLAEMVREQQAALYNEENDKRIAEQAAIDRERASYYENMIQREKTINDSINSRINMLAKVKEGFVAECLNKLFTESYGYPMTSSDKVIAKNLINKFITENGAGDIISSFATKNLVLSEFSRICSKYYNKVLEGCSKSKKNECDQNLNGQISDQVIDQRVVDDFYKELEEVNVADASKAIKDRVADAISDFIDTNAANKVEYQDIIQQAQDKAAIVKDEEISESYIEMAKARINNMRATRERNVFGYMVESLTASAFKDEDLRARYIHEATVDMDGIVNSAQLIYTMLEMVNTMNMVNVNEKFISDYLSSL